MKVSDKLHGPAALPPEKNPFQQKAPEPI